MQSGRLPHQPATCDSPESTALAPQAIVRMRGFLESTAALTGTTIYLVGGDGEILIQTGAAGPCEGCAQTACAQSNEKEEDHCVFHRVCPKGCEYLAARIPGAAGYLDCLIVPLVSSEEGRPAPSPNPELERFIRESAITIGTLMREHTDMELMSEELSTCYEELNLLYAVSERLGRGGDLRSILRYILEECQSTTGSDWAMLHVEDRCVLEVSGWAGELRDAGPAETQLLAQLTATIRHELMASALQPVLYSEEVEAELAAVLGEPAKLAAVPILVNGSLNGSLVVAQLARTEAVSTHDLKLVQALAAQVSLSITNWDLYDNLRDFLLNTVRCLVSAIDAKDRYTRGHSERVHQVSMTIGQSLGISPADMESLRWASLLHDVGKIAVPEFILRKPTSLTEEEMEIIQQHPVRGCHLLSSISQLGSALDGIRHHHERFDGSGYPDCLRGEEIPLGARIIAVADIFDALTSERAYRQALPPAEVRAYIRAAAGKQLDPRVVEAFDATFPDLLAHTRLAVTGGGTDPMFLEETDGCVKGESRDHLLSHAIAAVD